jgi:nicotinamide-nucleotide amidase
MEQSLLLLSAEIGSTLVARGYTISTAESCTGGLLSQTLTGISGSSAYFIGGVVAYSNQVKEQVLGVRTQTLIEYGAVSEQTACEMAQGIRNQFNTDIGLSTTGIAGPTGGTPEKPVGLAWIGISTPDGTQAYECHFKGDRLEVMHRTVMEILTHLLTQIKGSEKTEK